MENSTATPTHTFNIDIVAVCNRMNRIITELQMFASGNTSEVYPADLTRIKSYFSGLRTYHDTIQALERMDFVETNTQLEELRALPPSVQVENENLNDLVRLMRRGHSELTNSQSARDSSKLNKYDSARFLAMLDRAEKFAANYIEKVTPLDFPNSSPRAGSILEGQTGI